MNTMTIPGFTAEASLYRKGAFGKATVAASQNTTARVQPAIRYYTCFNIGSVYEDFLEQDDYVMAGYWYGVAKGLGCDLSGYTPV